MLGYLRDRLQLAQLQVRYQRIVQERLLQLTETSSNLPVSEDPGRWALLGSDRRSLDDHSRADLRTRARSLVRDNPHASNILRLLEIYVAGPGLMLGHQPRRLDDESPEVTLLRQRADRLWEDFLIHNDRHYSYREHARRTWRDGECFLRKFGGLTWPPDVRFVDPETIAPTPDHPDSQGILTDPHDAESPRWYLHSDDPSSDVVQRIPADVMLHTRCGVDSNQKRGVSIFAPLVGSLDRFGQWIETELTARKLQASIVLWRKVSGAPSSAAAFVDDSDVASLTDPTSPSPVNRFRPGSILTTSQSTDLQFLHPDTNYRDAVPLGRLLLLSTAAGAGLPEFMLTGDASNANYASTMVAEGPAVKMFQAEQQFFKEEFSRLWRWILEEAIAAGELPGDFFERVAPQWCFPDLVNRDRPREREADVKLVETRVLSRAEVARRDGADPGLMQRELEREESGEPLA